MSCKVHTGDIYEVVDNKVVRVYDHKWLPDEEWEKAHDKGALVQVADPGYGYPYYDEEDYEDYDDMPPLVKD